jgi:hypothetical protein
MGFEMSEYQKAAFRNYIPPKTDSDSRATKDTVSKPQLVAVKKRTDALNFARELKKVNQRLIGWDL